MEYFMVELLLLAVLGLVVYKYLTKNDDFFEKRGVKYVKPTVFFGNMLGAFTGRENGISMFHNLCEKFADEKVFGWFRFMRPVFIVKDAELIKQITVKDFDTFVNHDSSFSKSVESHFGKALALLEDDSWREMRNILSPMFTSSKMKVIHNLLSSCSQDLIELFEESFEKTGRIVIESREIFSRFTAESVCIATLGFKANCIKDKKSKIYELAQHINEDFTGVLGTVKMLLMPVFPSLSKLLKASIFRKSTYDFFDKYFMEESRRRESEGITSANDALQVLINARNDKLKSQPSKANKIDWNDYEIVPAQLFTFFAAGLETTTTLMELCSWELAINQEIQNDLISEVDGVHKSLNGGPISFEALTKMKFLDMVIQEALRKWPPAPLGERECSRDYILVKKDEETVRLKKGDIIFIPFHSIHHDPKYFENPSKFDPRRFSDDNKQKIIPGSFLPFGYGPRMCIGVKLAILEAKLLFFTILSKYSIDVCDKTPQSMIHSSSPFKFNEKVYVELKPRLA